MTQEQILNYILHIREQILDYHQNEILNTIQELFGRDHLKADIEYKWLLNIS